MLKERIEKLACNDHAAQYHKQWGGKIFYNAIKLIKSNVQIKKKKEKTIKYLQNTLIYLYIVQPIFVHKKNDTMNIKGVNENIMCGEVCFLS